MTEQRIPGLTNRSALACDLRISYCDAATRRSHAGYGTRSMNSAVIAKGDRVLLVSADSCDEVRECLQSRECAITKVTTGEDAIFQAQHATFNMAVLVSTGKTMDVAETVLNLRDARPAMPMVIVTGDTDREEADVIAQACPNARSLSLDRLKAYLSMYESGKRIAGRRSRP